MHFTLRQFTVAARVRGSNGDYYRHGTIELVDEVNEGDTITRGDEECIVIRVFGQGTSSAKLFVEITKDLRGEHPLPRTVHKSYIEYNECPCCGEKCEQHA